MLLKLKKLLKFHSEGYYRFRERLLMNSELPTITSSSYSTATYDSYAERAGANGRDEEIGSGGAGGHTITGMSGIINTINPHILLGGVLGKAIPNVTPHTVPQYDEEYTFRKNMATITRLVRVFIFDPNENIPLESRMLAGGKEKLTDLTDQELFFELPIADLLAKHNELRAKTQDKAQTSKLGKEVYLEPVRIRDLRMVVTTVAQF